MSTCLGTLFLGTGVNTCGGEGGGCYHPLSQQGDSEAQRIDLPTVTGQANLKWACSTPASSCRRLFCPARWSFPMAGKHCSIGSGTSRLKPDWDESRVGRDFPIGQYGSTKVPGQDVVLMLAPPGLPSGRVLPPHSPILQLSAPGTSAETSETRHPVCFYENQSRPGRGRGSQPLGKRCPAPTPAKGGAALKEQAKSNVAKNFHIFPLCLQTRKFRSLGWGRAGLRGT